MWKLYAPHGTKAIVVSDAAFNCLTSANKRNKNNHYILKLQKDWQVVFLQNIVTFMLRIIFKCQKSTNFRNRPYCVLITSNCIGFGNIWQICEMDPPLTERWETYMGISSMEQSSI